MPRSNLAVLVALTACLSFPISHDEVSRVPSSAVDLDAVLVETNGGATTSFGYLVYVVARGKKPADGTELASLYGAVRNDQAFGANLKWEGRSQLVVEYRDAREERVRRPTSVIESDTVTILLRSGITDSGAPAGGMLYDLQRVPR
jgi:hypothetical protein